MTDPKPLDLLEPGVLLKGALMRSLGEEVIAQTRLAAGTRLGPFRVVEEIGHGGMGVVYRAERDDGSYQQQVAIKCMIQTGSESRAALFLRERQILAELKHPHIARLLDGGHDANGQHWLAMELVEGERIDRHAHTHGLSVDARVRLLLQVIEAVQAAHARLLMHRDIKPSNVLVDADGRAKLLDFGIAALIDDIDAQRAYSPRWASPEQHARENVGPASDQYQLALLLDAVLAGPTEADRDAPDTSPATIDGSRWPTMARARRVELLAIVRKAAATTPGARYGSVAELGRDLEHWLALRPVSARGGGVAYTVACAIRRHPLLASAMVLAVAGAIGFTALFNVRLAEQRDIAQAQRVRADREANDARAISRFLHEDLLAAANPLNRPAGAPEVTVREALDRADTVVSERFKAQPETAVSVLTTLGNLHHEFGDYDRAKRVFDNAIALAVKHGITGTTVDRARLERGALHISESEYVVAAEMLDALVKAMADYTDPVDVAMRLEARLRMLEARGYADATASLEPLETLARDVESAFGAPHALAAEARFLIGDFARARGTPLAAAATIELAHAQLQTTLGADHPTTLEGAVNVSHLRRAQGRMNEAIEGLQSAYALQVKRYGPEATNSMWMQNELGFLLMGMGRFDEAEPLLIDLIARHEHVNGLDTLPLISPLSNLANVRLRLKRPTEALPLLDRAAQILAVKRAEPAPLPFHLVIARGRADALRDLGRLAESGAILDRADALAAALPRSDLRVLALQGSRARLLIAHGERERGLTLLEATIASLREAVDDLNPTLSALLEAQAALTADTPR